MSGDKPLLFFDTNVLLYWLDPRDELKRQKARDWVLSAWQTNQARVSWQVLNEFYANATGKLRAGPREARSMVEAFVELKPVETNLTLTRRAWHWVDSSQVSYWDALILSAAESAGCTYLLSEDFQNGRTYGEVTVVNPFTNSPREFGCVPARRN